MKVNVNPTNVHILYALVECSSAYHTTHRKLSLHISTSVHLSASKLLKKNRLPYHTNNQIVLAMKQGIFLGIRLKGWYLIVSVQMSY